LVGNSASDAGKVRIAALDMGLQKMEPVLAREAEGTKRDEWGTATAHIDDSGRHGRGATAGRHTHAADVLALFNAQKWHYPKAGFSGRGVSMRPICTAVIALSLSAVQALAWGQEGHSIVAEIAQRRLNPQALDRVHTLLRGASLGSIASWADDVRGARQGTYNWHFVDIPLAADT
jgi:hypothetical protein